MHHPHLLAYHVALSCLLSCLRTHFIRYAWDDTGFQWMDQEGFHISAASFGIGAAPNCWLPLVNVEDTSTKYDTAGLHRSKDPGAGAIT